MEPVDGEQPHVVPAAAAVADDAAHAAPPHDPEEARAAELKRLKDQLLRTAADFDNFRKRTRKDLDEVERRSREEVIKEILPVADNLERALDAAMKASDIAAVIEGVRMVLKLFEDVSRRIGLERVPSVGHRFDPSFHDAIQQVETTEHPPGSIVSEIVPGYRLGERLLRAALVVVARPPAAIPEGGGPGGPPDAE